MALNTFKCNHLTPLHFKGLTRRCQDLVQERHEERSSHNILPMERLAGKITSSLHESNFACYNCINGITSTADEYKFTSYNIKICGRTVEEEVCRLSVSSQ